MKHTIYDCDCCYEDPNESETMRDYGSAVSRLTFGGSESRMSNKNSDNSAYNIHVKDHINVAVLDHNKRPRAAA